MATDRSRVVVAFLVCAAAAACTAPPPAAAPAPWSEAGRVIGGRVATVELAAACTRSDPVGAPALARALADWQWRNDALAVEVEDAMWRTVRARGASEAAIAAGRQHLRMALAEAANEAASDFAAWPPARRERYCRALPERLLSGDDDLVRRYPDAVRAWHPAAK